MSVLKSKTPSKKILTRSQGLDDVVSKTLDVIAEIVGGTLGPGGSPVLIEREEYGVAPMITKDGVTVFQHLGFSDPVMHCIMESARDVSVKTANEAGDGTTSSCVMAAALNRSIRAYINTNHGVSPHWVLSEIQKTFDSTISPLLVGDSIKVDLESEEGRSRIRAIAKLSANGDDDLAAAVLRCFDVSGDDGNVTISEESGPYAYRVDQIEGYPINIGLEQCCQRYAATFMNDSASQRCVMDNPIFVLHYGTITDFNTVQGLLTRINDAWKGRYLKAFNIVLVATGFSENVLANLASIWGTEGTINVFPLVAPMSPIANSQHEFLYDLGAVTGAKVLDPINAPLEYALITDLGNVVTDYDTTEDGREMPIYSAGKVASFESGRYRSSIHGFVSEDLLIVRADEVRIQSEQASSQLDREHLRERLAKLTGGIARLIVVGAGSGEIRERKDRAEDAICAVRGALRRGCLVGGGWTLLKVIDSLPKTEICERVIRPALFAPVELLCVNSGISVTEVSEVISKMGAGKLKGTPQEEAFVRDASTGEFVKGVESGILDSFPAVHEAIKNAISIAGVLGTTGGVVVHPRNHETELADARDRAEFNRMMKEFDPNRN